MALGAGIGLAALVRRRARALWAHGAELAVLLLGAVAVLAWPDRLGHLAWPLFWVFAAVALVPALLLMGGRGLAAARRFAGAAACLRGAALLLGLPRPIRREAALFGALAAADRGDEADVRRRVAALLARRDLPRSDGTDVVVALLPHVAARRWGDVLAALDAAPSVRRPPGVLAVEVRAAAETGDLRRALEALGELEHALRPGHALIPMGRRSVLAGGGRAEFLAEALSARLPVATQGPRGAGVLAIGRALESDARAEEAVAAYREARRVGVGALRRDAELGIERCAGGAPRVARPDEEERESLLELESRCRTESPAPEALPLSRRAAATFVTVGVTGACSVLVLALLGADPFALLAAGALSAPLVIEEGEWWRLGTAMLLHGGPVHLLANATSTIMVGIPLETHYGAARTVLVYLASGFLASAASVYLNHTDVGVGASGAAMGLFGALLVLLLLRPDLFDPAARRRWLAALGLGLGATALIGLLEYEVVDNMAHGAGLLGGAVLGWLLRPGAFEGRTHRAARRLAAGALCALLLVCALAAASRLPEWTSKRKPVHGEGFRAELPAWLRARPTRDGGLVAARPPVELAVLLGSVPDVAPDPRLLLPGEREVLDALERGPAESGTVRHGELVEEVHTYRLEGAGAAAGFRIVSLRRGSAFALVALPLQAVEEESSRDTLDALRETLRPAE